LKVPHEALIVHAESEVSVQPRAKAAPDAPAPVEAAEFLFESAYVERSRELADYAVKSFTARRPILESASDLARRIHRDFKFDRTATSVSTPLKQVLRDRRGVCQDFAHLMIGCLRSIGLAAHYVSGRGVRAAAPRMRPTLGLPSIVVSARAGWTSIRPTTASSTMPTSRSAGDAISPTSRRCAA
jgi:transglutaminase-like putative cysteine protease